MLNTWQTLFRPEFTHGGIDALTRGAIARSFDDMESYTNDAAVAAVWAGTNTTVTLSSVADAIHGNQSMQIAVSGGDGNVISALDQTFFGSPAPGRIRYIAFNATVATGTDAIAVRLNDNSDANLYREWDFTISTDETKDYIIDLWSGGDGFQNSESYPGPSATGSTAWDEALIDQIQFREMANGGTVRIDHIRFFYDYSLLDAIGFGTEAATADGVDGSVHSKLRTIVASLLDNAEITQVVIYPVAENQATTELVGDGVTKVYNFDTESTTSSAINEGTMESAWTEMVDFEQNGTVSIISIYAEFDWQTKFDDNGGGGTNSISKIQMTGDSGSTWVDVTDNFTNAATSYTDRLRAGVGAWIAVTAGANQLGFRLMHWSDDSGGTDRSNAKIATNSYVRITYRKS
jgi:hypothetical protein